MAKYFYVPYATTDEDDWTATRGMIVRVKDKKALLQALHEETREGDFPPEFAEALEREPFAGGSAEGAGDMTYYLVGAPTDYDEEEGEPESVTYLLRYGDPEPMDSVEQAMARALQDRVYEPHLYRLDARGGLQPISFGSKGSDASKNPNSDSMIIKDVNGNDVTLEVGDRVRPAGQTKRGISYGYVRAITEHPNDPRSHARKQATVYWPETKQIGGGWTSIDIVALPKGRKSKNPAPRTNTHDAKASTDALLTTLWHGVHSFERAGSTTRDNDRRAALATAQWELGQAWTHGQYAEMSADDRNDVRVWVYELAMRVHELIADDGKPTKQEIENTNASAEQVTEFVQRSRFGAQRAANLRTGTR